MRAPAGILTVRIASVYSVSSVVRDKEKINHREHFCRYNIGYYTPINEQRSTRNEHVVARVTRAFLSPYMPT